MDEVKESLGLMYRPDASKRLDQIESSLEKEALTRIYLSKKWLLLQN